MNVNRQIELLPFPKEETFFFSAGSSEFVGFSFWVRFFGGCLWWGGMGWCWFYFNVPNPRTNHSNHPQFRQKICGICGIRPPKLGVCSLIMVSTTLGGFVDGKTTGRPFKSTGNPAIPGMPRSLARFFVKSTVFSPPSSEAWDAMKIQAGTPWDGFAGAFPLLENERLRNHPQRFLSGLLLSGHI